MEIKNIVKIIKKKLFYNFTIFKNETINLKNNYPYYFHLMEIIIYFPIWLIKLNANSLSDEKPWIPFKSYVYLKKIIKKDMFVFEYGSGGSTLFFAKRVRKVISVEHNEIWYLKLKKIIEFKNYKNCKITLIKPEIFKKNNNYDYSDLESYKSSDDNYKNMSFENYCKVIDTYPNYYFDIIFIDGRSRPSCVKHSVNKLKINGYLIIDDSDRCSYRKIYNYLNNDQWQRIDFIGPKPYVSWFTKLSVWIKIY